MNAIRNQIDALAAAVCEMHSLGAPVSRIVAAHAAQIDALAASLPLRVIWRLLVERCPGLAGVRYKYFKDRVYAERVKRRGAAAEGVSPAPEPAPVPQPTPPSARARTAPESRSDAIPEVEALFNTGGGDDARTPSIDEFLKGLKK